MSNMSSSTPMPVTPDLTPSPIWSDSSNGPPRLPPLFLSEAREHRQYQALAQRKETPHPAAFPKASSPNGLASRDGTVEFRIPFLPPSNGRATHYPTPEPQRSPLPPIVAINGSNDRMVFPNGSSPDKPSFGNGSMDHMEFSTPSKAPSWLSTILHPTSRPERQLINIPKIVLRPARTLADSPQAAMAKMNEQASKDQLLPDCRIFTSPLLEYLRRCPHLEHIHAFALIFTHPSKPPSERQNGSGSTKHPYLQPRLLMLQRPANELENPGAWELPGGHVQSGEMSIFHGLARGVWYYTNLNISWVARQIGKGEVFASKCEFRKDAPGDDRVYFETHCLEIHQLSNYRSFSDKKLFHALLDNIPVRISEAHQAWSWVTKEGIKLMLEGEVDANFADEEHCWRALRAFEVREKEATVTHRARNGRRAEKRRREVEKSVNEDQ